MALRAMMTVAAEPTTFPAPESVYRQFSSLLALAHANFGGELGGRLILLAPLDEAAAATSLAANIAGAALLGIDPSDDRLKWGIRNGVCDFMVNHLDEALRILKNEVRKKQPASVWLQADLETSLVELVARGVQPDVYAWEGSNPVDAGALAELETRGAVRLTQPAESLPCEVSWSVASGAALWLPKIDALAVQALNPAAEDRRRWLQFAPRYLGRAFLGNRYLRMDRDEARRLADLIRREVEAGEIQALVKLRIERSGHTELIEFRRGLML